MLKLSNPLERSPEFYSRKIKRRVFNNNDFNDFEDVKSKIKKLEERVLAIPISFYLRYKSFGIYRSRVDEITNKQNLSLLGDIALRGFRKWDVDHIISLECGYKNQIPPQLIGNIKNLQLIPHFENVQKGGASFCIIKYCEHLKELRYELS